jgi:hypothetical protein
VRLFRDDLDRMAAESGFQAEPLEKVLHLLDLLQALRSHPYLTDRLVLKGGTALNLFLLSAPRLSVDIDLNYVGSPTREVMVNERPLVEQAVHAVCARQTLAVARVPGEHAGGKWRLGYPRVSGGSGRLELDLNYTLRVPLWAPERRDSSMLGGIRASRVPLLDAHELVAGKLAALFGRTTSRDLFDTQLLLRRAELEPDRLRIAFVVYGAMSRRDWRTVSTDDVRMEPADAERRLLPLLRNDIAPPRRELGDWCRRLTDECRDRLSSVLPLRPAEREFVGLVVDRGEVAPGLLTDDSKLQERIRAQPALQWRARHAQGRADGPVDPDAPPSPPGGDPDTRP